MSDYEQARLANIAANKALLSSLGIEPRPEIKAPKPELASKSRPKKRKSSPAGSSNAHHLLAPSRKSSRISGIPAPSYTGDGAQFFDDEETGGRRGRSVATSSSSTAGAGPSITRIRQLPRAPSPPAATVPDEYDPSYVQPLPTRDAGDKGTFRFEAGFEGFTPNVAPWEVMREGSFGGTYWRPFYSRVKKEQVEPGLGAFPAEWFDPPIDTETYLTSTTYRPEINRYGVKASQSIEDWEKAGWIRANAPRGWMEWYCHFFLGRRSFDDHRQISRWNGCAGPRGRFKTSLVKKIAQAGGVEHLDDDEVAPILRQTLLHWAVELTQESFEAYLA